MLTTVTSSSSMSYSPVLPNALPNVRPTPTEGVRRPVRQATAAQALAQPATLASALPATQANVAPSAERMRLHLLVVDVDPVRML